MRYFASVNHRANFQRYFTKLLDVLVIYDITLSSVVTRHDAVYACERQNVRVIHCAATKRKASRKSPQSSGVRRTTVIRIEIANSTRGKCKMRTMAWRETRSEEDKHSRLLADTNYTWKTTTEALCEICQGYSIASTVQRFHWRPHTVTCRVHAAFRQRPILCRDQRTDCRVIISEFHGKWANKGEFKRDFIMRNDRWKVALLASSIPSSWFQ